MRVAAAAPSRLVGTPATLGIRVRRVVYRDAFLFGRRTYEIFAGSWGTWADPGGNPIWTALNTRPKYVASTTLTDPQWSDTTVLSGDLATAIADLKAKPRGRSQYETVTPDLDT